MSAPATPLEDPVVETFRAALSGLGSIDVRVVHLAMTQAVELETAGRGGEADALLLTLLRLVEDPQSFDVVTRRSASLLS